MAKLRPELPSVPTRVSMTSEFVNCSAEQEYNENDEEQEVKVYNVSSVGLQNIPHDLEDRDGYYFVMDVSEPVTLTAKQGRMFANTFTTYLIRVETNHPAFPLQFNAIRRRYSEFVWLREQLLKSQSNCQVPSLPSKNFISFINYKSSFIHGRQKGLSNFLQRVLETPSFLSQPCLHFFLQSQLSVMEMQQEVAQNPQNLTDPLLVSPLTCSSSSSMTVSSDENSDEENQVATIYVSQTQFSESEKSSNSSNSNPPAASIPIPIPMSNSNVLIPSCGASSVTSSDGDSGHFEASSSPASLPKPIKLPKSLILRDLSPKSPASCDKCREQNKCRGSNIRSKSPVYSTPKFGGNDDFLYAANNPLMAYTFNG